MDNFVWDDSTWNQYIQNESQYRDSLPGEINGDYVGAIRLDEFIPVPVTQEKKVVNLHQRFTQPIVLIAI